MAKLKGLCHQYPYHLKTTTMQNLLKIAGVVLPAEKKLAPILEQG
jgi:hypothetical protein